MKKVVFILFCVFFLVLVFLAACKKKKAFKNEDGQDAVDVRFIQGENDLALKEINEALNKQAAFRGLGSSASGNADTTLVCGLSVDTTKVSKGILILNYKGTNCSQRQRKGKITLTIQNYPYSKLKDQDCIIRIDFNSYSITHLSDGQSITINGTEYIENVSGGTWYELLYLNLPNLIENVTGQNFQVKFSNSDIVATYNVSRRYTYTCDSKKIITCTADGTGTDGSASNLESWGMLKNGANYTAQAASPVVWNSNCGALLPVQGDVIIKSDKKEFTLDCLYGTDSNGNGAVIACPYGWKTTWKYKNKSKTKVFSY